MQWEAFNDSFASNYLPILDPQAGKRTQRSVSICHYKPLCHTRDTINRNTSQFVLFSEHGVELVLLLGNDYHYLIVEDFEM